MQDLKKKFEEAYRVNGVNKVTNIINYNVGKFTNNEDVVVSDDALGSNPTEKRVKEVLNNMIGKSYLNKSNNTNIYIENIDILKYLHDGYNNIKNAKLKKRLSGNYGEVLEISKIDLTSSKSNVKGPNRGRQGYDYYNINLAFPIKDNKQNIIDYRYYSARLVVRKDNNNNYAYDLDNFKEKKGVALDKTSLSIAAGKPASNTFSEINLPQKNSKVNKNDSLNKELEYSF